MFLTKAMRYYRVWIYSCNAALFAATLFFLITFAWLAADSRLPLFPSIKMYHPTIIYAMLALLVQAGIVQVISSGATI